MTRMREQLLQICRPVTHQASQAEERGSAVDKEIIRSIYPQLLTKHYVYYIINSSTRSHRSFTPDK